MPQPIVDSNVSFEEVFDFKPAEYRTTSEGYIVASPRVARTGIQEYRGDELGHPEMEKVRVYRDEAQVFNKESLKTFAHRTITLGHPEEMVDAKNWRKLAIGMTGDEVARDGDFIRVPMLVMDAEAVNQSRARELSVGYSSEIVWEAGVTKDGLPYDASQRGIQVNHIAIVPQARGGPKLRLGDNNRGAYTMPNERITRTITVDGVELILPDTEAAVVNRTISRMNDETVKLNDQIAKLTKDLASSTAAADAAKKLVENRDGEIIVLKKQVEDAKLTPEALDKMVTARTAVIDSAKRILGKDYTGTGKTDAQIKREAVEKALGDAAKNLTDANIDGAFIGVTAGASDGSGTRVLADALGTSSRQLGDGRVLAAKAWEDRQARTVDAWQNKPGTA